MIRGWLMLACVIGCSEPDEMLNSKLDNAAGVLEIYLENLEKQIRPGNVCGWLTTVERQRDKWDDQHAFVAVTFDVYQTKAGSKFDALAKRFNEWDRSTFKPAVSACSSCIEAKKYPCEIP